MHRAAVTLMIAVGIMALVLSLIWGWQDVYCGDDEAFHRLATYHSAAVCRQRTRAGSLTKVARPYSLWRSCPETCWLVTPSAQ